MATKQPNRAHGSRLTPALAAEYTPVPNAFIEHCGRPRKGGLGLGLAPIQAMILVQLMNFKKDERMPFPAINTLATRLGVASTTVRTNIDDMEKQGLLVKHLRTGDTTLYDLTPLFRRLEAIQEKAAARKAAKKEEAEAKRYPEHYSTQEVAAT